MNNTNASLMTDDELWYILASYKYDFIRKTRKPQWTNITKRYGVTEENRRETLPKWIKATSYPLLDPSEEIIPRNEWVLDLLSTPSIEALNHPHIDQLTDHIFNTFKRTSDTLCILQCSNAKPYGYTSGYKSAFEIYEPYVDFAFSSLSGAIPKEYTKLYPCRFTEWGHAAASHEAEEALYDKKTDTIFRFFKAMGYKRMYIFIQNPKAAYKFKEYYEKNVDGCQEWMEFVIDQELLDKIADTTFPGLYSAKGLSILRSLTNPMTRDKFEGMLRKVLPEHQLEAFEETCKLRKLKYAKSKSGASKRKQKEQL